MITKRGKRWIVRLWVPDDTKPEGRRRAWIGTYDTKTEAREAEAQAVLERASRPRQARQWTVEEFAERWYLRFHGPGTRRPVDNTLVYNRDAVKQFVRAHGKRRLHQFDQAMARDYAAEFPWRARPVKAMFADAVRDGKLTVSPFAGVSIATGKGRRHIHPLSMDEIERLALIAEDALGFYGSHFAAFIRWHGWTGMRPGEVVRMEWSDMRWDLGKLDIPKTKTKYPRLIRLAPPALEILQSMPRLDDRVWRTKRDLPMRQGSYGYFWRQVRGVFESEVPRDHWLARRLREDPEDHLDLYEARHATVSMLVHEGLNIEQVAKYVGHSPEECRKTYVHLYEDRYEDALLAAFERIGRSVGAQPGRSDVG